MFSAKQLVPFLLRLWYDAVIDWLLNPGPPALEASTIPLGYQEGGCEHSYNNSCLELNLLIY